MTTATKRAHRCPSCNSPAAHRFPAAAFEGEALGCPDEWHLTDPQYPPTDVMRGLVERGRENEPASEQSGAGSTCPTRYEQLLAQETLIFDATEEICRVMSPDQDSSEVTRKQLADRLGKSKGFVTQVLAGDRNMTLRTLADFAGALGHKVSVHLEPIPGPPDEKPSTQHNLPEQGADASSEPNSCAEPECDGSGRIPSGECSVAMSGPTCFNAACPPCRFPETDPCPGCSACRESNRMERPVTLSLLTSDKVVEAVAQWLFEQDGRRFGFSGRRLADAGNGRQRTYHVRARVALQAAQRAMEEEMSDGT